MRFAPVFVGHRDDQDVSRRPRLKQVHPCPRLRFCFSLGSQHDRAGSMDEDLAQVIVTALADPVEFRLTAGRVPSFGTSPSHAANSRPLWKAAPLPIEATIAVATKGPMPGICLSNRRACRITRGDLFDFIVHLLDLKLQLLPLVPEQGPAGSAYAGSELPLRRFPGSRAYARAAWPGSSRIPDHAPEGRRAVG